MYTDTGLDWIQQAKQQCNESFGVLLCQNSKICRQETCRRKMKKFLGELLYSNSTYHNTE